MSIRLPSRNLVSQQDASMIQRPDVPRSKFSNSWPRLMTFDQGYLVPFLVQEILPGDRIRWDCTIYLRLQTLLFPMFSNLRIDTFFFFTPTRLVWSNFEKFYGEQVNPGDSTAFTIPMTASGPGGFPINSIYDHMGLPTIGQVTAGQQVSVSALPFRCHNLIWNEWFRDQDLINSLVVTLGDSGDPTYTLQKRAKSHDYFTSARPWAQKFVVSGIPLTGTAPVTGIGFTAGLSPAASGAAWLETSGSAPVYPFPAITSVANTIAVRSNTGGGVAGKPEIFADLAASTASVTVNALRTAIMLQSISERDARGGTRYVERIKSVFGVTSPDARLQRPEYIGGGSTPLQMTPIAQTATGGSGVGALAGAATAVGSHRADIAATEHGYVLGLINVRSELAYQQGIKRHWRRSTLYEFYDPKLALLGEQAILREEIYANGVDAEDSLVFGYQERWAEYRQEYGEVTGMFRSTTAGTIDPWHLIQRFTVAPVLGQTFIEDTAPMSRVLTGGTAVNNMQFLADILIRREAVRPLPAFSTPATFGRF